MRAWKIQFITLLRVKNNYFSSLIGASLYFFLVYYFLVFKGHLKTLFNIVFRLLPFNFVHFVDFFLLLEDNYSILSCKKLIGSIAGKFSFASFTASRAFHPISCRWDDLDLFCEFCR